MKEILIIIASTVVFVLAVIRESHWLWWLAGLPLVMVALLGVAWLFAFLWLPKVAASRLAHLPTRQVQVEASDVELSFQTGTEQLRVAWSEFKALKRRPNFCIVCLRSGTRIPIPAELLTKEGVSFLEAKLAAFDHADSKAG